MEAYFSTGQSPQRAVAPTEEEEEDDNDIFINCNWVVTRWQYTFTHKQYIEQHK